MRQAELKLLDDLHNEYPIYGEAYFSEVQSLIHRIVGQGVPTTDAELQSRLITLGEIALAVYRVRERIELGTVM
jgi:hypothetical protein